ncbi:MAG: aminotransferase class V-fold PLP-dependent enzyme, partial [Candidatus Eremiobacteraeota bacterium]|nr:aminotransferase class V-fold PLP-dependent enzyme [Candidatus Eremiobacteraeota bacterium]
VLHTDAVQVPAHLPIDVRELGVDLLSISAHKFYGPKGVGALYVRQGTPLLPLIVGGSQEFAKRAGTENVAGIVGMARALEFAVGELPQVPSSIAVLRDRLENGIRERIAGVRVNGRGNPRLANSCNVSFAGVDGEGLLIGMDLEGIAVSTGSACASGSLQPSHVVAALGTTEQWTRGVVRFSLGRANTQAEIDRTLEVLAPVVDRLRGAGSTMG